VTLIVLVQFWASLIVIEYDPATRDEKLVVDA
jgi:hypothetical protein